MAAEAGALLENTGNDSSVSNEMPSKPTDRKVGLLTWNDVCMSY
jgi:hypothetical protein